MNLRKVNPNWLSSKKISDRLARTEMKKVFQKSLTNSMDENMNRPIYESTQENIHFNKMDTGTQGIPQLFGNSSKPWMT